MWRSKMGEAKTSWHLSFTAVSLCSGSGMRWARPRPWLVGGDRHSWTVKCYALRSESIGGIERTLACPGTKLEHTAFFSVKRKARRSPRSERRVDWRHQEHSSLSRNEVRAYSLFLGMKESPESVWKEKLNCEATKQSSTGWRFSLHRVSTFSYQRDSSQLAHRGWKKPPPRTQKVCYNKSEQVAPHARFCEEF
jgi:hypothetical protein